ncbi:hypothetical protein CPB84DRAFT_1845064 [Gymnopilus junonius]|uniref:Uncharacterized protein n=1 Tax=Gymnopilus junonius TaxID=109634 RepID=A0A9P5NUS4_GYMJU|nr:hypothetical protein CPB84DRAFT_1845064 [Gymnopilus junonius]
MRTYLLRGTLPHSLTAPIPLHQNRQAKHFEIAGGLRTTQDAKRTAAKARADQKKQDLTNKTDQTGPGLNKHMRLDMEGDGTVAGPNVTAQSFTFVLERPSQQ